MKRFPLICLAIAASCFVAQAQPIMPPAIERGQTEPAPTIDANAQQFVEAIAARYAALRSYSDVTQLRVENAAGEPVKLGGWSDDAAFRATLQWERPARIRFEGTDAKGAFLALGTDDIIRIVSGHYPGYYVARPRNPDWVMTPRNPQVADLNEPATWWTVEVIPNTQPIRLEEPLMGSPIPGGPALGLLTDPEFLPRNSKDVRVLSFDADAQVGGETCRVVRMQLAFDDGGTAVMRLFAAHDGLVRRVELRDSRMPADTFIVETHSQVRADPDLPASVWNFEAPTDAKIVDYFSQLDQGKTDPALQVGATLPTFSADALNGEPLELNAKSGKVTVVYFFTINSGLYDVQTLSKLQRVVGADKLQIIGVSGDGLRPRVEAFVGRYQPNFPIYFDENARNNALAAKFGVKSWTSTFIFDQSGKLRTAKGAPGTVEFLETLQTLLPGTPDDAFFLPPDAITAPP